MVMKLAQANPAFLPEDVGRLIVQPVTRMSVAAQCSTLVNSAAAGFRIPVITSDASALHTEEGAQIAPSAPLLDEVNVVFYAVKAVVPISNEALNDTSPAAAQFIGDRLARSLSGAMDAAYFGNLTAFGPAGIKSLTGITTVNAGGTWVDADPFIEAIYAAENVGATINTFVANPADALLLASLKEGTTSARNLLQPDAAAGFGRTIAGVPLITSPAVTVGQVYGIPRDRVVLCIRQAADLKIDGSFLFDTDSTMIRAVLRYGIGWPHEAAVIRVTKA